MYGVAVPCSPSGCILRGFVLEVFKNFIVEFNPKVVTSRIHFFCFLFFISGFTFIFLTGGFTFIFLIGGFTFIFLIGGFIGFNALIEGLFRNICVEELDAGM